MTNSRSENLGFLFCRRRHGNLHALHSLKTRGFALESAEVIELRAAHAALAQYLDRTDRRRIRREYAFDAHAETDAAYCEACSGGLPALLYHHPFKRLNAFLFALGLFQAHVDAHRIPRPQRGQVFPHLCFLKLLNDAIHGQDSLRTHSGGVSTANTISNYSRNPAFTP